MKFLDIEKLRNNIDKIALYDISNNNVFGSSYFVMQNGGVTFKKHFGYTDIDGINKVNDGTMYRLASMSKPIAAAAILILADRGLISLNDSVSKFIPEFEDIHIITKDGVDLGRTNTPVTVLNCLCHTSGFGSGKEVNMSAADKESISATLKLFIDSGLEFEPGTNQNYSPFAAFDILAAIVEKVTCRDYADFLKKEIFVPCNMTDTTFSPTEEQWQRLIAMHDKADNKNTVGKSYQGCVFEDFPCGHKLAGAALVSTLNDYSSFTQMLLNKGEINHHRILSESICGKFSIPHMQKEFSPGEKWSLGMRVIADKSYPNLPVGSFGWSGAYGSHFWIDPKNEICAVFMKNSKIDGGAGNASARRFEKAVYDALL